MREVIGKPAIQQLEALLETIADSIDAAANPRDLAPLTKQYRETLKEIDELKKTVVENDEIAEIISKREAKGKPGAVRKSKSKV